MTAAREIVISESLDAAAVAAAERFIRVLTEVQAAGRAPQVVLTGGTLGIKVLEATGSSAAASRVDWSNVDLYWGDERWMPNGHADRNDEQAREGFLEALSIPTDRIHRFPASDDGLTLDEAAVRYSATIAPAMLAGFDVVFLGVGPDGHVASLFPARPDLTDATDPVIAVRNSPKPPPERLSLTIPLINTAHRVWLLCTGAPKREAYANVLANVGAETAPAAVVRGTDETVIFADTEVLG
ncbi:6-phosphogluconolactonase [Lysinibacter cavernae]|uniref:6-phosphogluconolactonase n=1 Tax=Lysinibacter cavernae TaxID=1640652 RepID=A0A7X5QZF0_9MICO|nr:6-phosphogluconolactonase [Lysinibacter cavernae]NIH52830.1 6-phosphogluconolactonase [Lysinibacter cavernae]